MGVWPAHCRTFGSIPGLYQCHVQLCQSEMSVVVAVQPLSCVSLVAIPWTAARQASLSFTISRSWLKLMSIESVMPSKHLIFCHFLLLPSVFISIGVCFSELALHIRWPKCWSFSLRPSNENSESVSFRT